MVENENEDKSYEEWLEEVRQFYISWTGEEPKFCNRIQNLLREYHRIGESSKKAARYGHRYDEFIFSEEELHPKRR